MLTKAQFKAKAERMFRSANPDAADATITWEFVGGVFPMHDGSGKARTGQFTVTADGYKPTRMVATVDPYGFGIR